MGLRIRIFIISMFLTVGISQATETLRWEDICPKGLADAEYREIKFYWPEGSKATQSYYNYWAERREEFNESKKQCDAMDFEFRDECYDNIKKRQYFYKDQYKRDVQKQHIKRQIWRDDHEKGSTPIMIDIFQR